MTAPPGAQLAALRRVLTRPCTECGTPLTGLSTRRYCSGACRSRAHYHRAKQHAAENATLTRIWRSLFDRAGPGNQPLTLTGTPRRRRPAPAPRVAASTPLRAPGNGTAQNSAGSTGGLAPGPAPVPWPKRWPDD